MKLIVAGSRNVTDVATVWNAINDWCNSKGFMPTALLHGGCRGVDALAGEWAEAFLVPVTEYPADWDRHGKAAGPIRNQRLVDAGDALLAIWDGKSRGTADIVRKARVNGLDVTVVTT